MFIAPTNQTYTPNFCAYEKSFMIVKPDAVQRKLDGKIMEEIQDAGLVVLKQWSGVAPRSKMEGNYIQYREKPFFKAWIDFMISGNIKAMIVGGEDAIKKASGVKQKMRAQYAPGERRLNLLHASDDTEAAQKEIANFFDELI